MAEQYYILPDNPEFKFNIRKLRVTDRAHADSTFNPLMQDILESVYNVYLGLQDKAKSDHDHNGIYQPVGDYAAAIHDHNGVYQPAGEYAAANHNHEGVYQAKGSYASLVEFERLKDTVNNISVETLGALPKSGGTLTGNLRLKDSSSYGLKLNFGDGDYVYLAELVDDVLDIKAKYFRFTVTEASTNPLPVNQGGTGVTSLTSLLSALADAGGNDVVIYSTCSTSAPSSVLANGHEHEVYA